MAGMPGGGGVVPARSPDDALLRPGETCWRLETARRVGIAVDGEEYFTAVKAAMRQARRSIYISAWDFDARIRLTPHRHRARRPDRLGNLLNWLAASRPDLTIHVLKWDFAELFDLARWSKPLAIRNLLSHPRLHYRLDGDHPTGASHHQKFVVIDDCVAFCGGFDLTANRWDSRAHHAVDRYRRQPDGAPYGPFHDMMMVVDGDAARALGDLFRERWRRATGEWLLCPTDRSGSTRGMRRYRRAGDVWPGNLPVLLRDVPVGIARTEPARDGAADVREVEALHLAAIAAARHSIYIESQYFASTAVAAALQARLAEDNGPEVVVINPLRSNSWLENTVMLGTRARLAAALRAADHQDRFRLFAALTEDGVSITVHAKALVVDDRLMRIGSANLANRSMGLDTECDLAVEACGPQADNERRVICQLRDNLLAEHLGSSPEVVADTLASTGSLIATIDRLNRDRGRRLVPLVEGPPEGFAAVASEVPLFDPERAVSAADLMRSVLPSNMHRHHRVLVATVLALAAGSLMGVGEWLGLPERGLLLSLLEAARSLATAPWMIPLLLAIIVIGTSLMLPLLPLVLPAILILGPLEGGVLALAGGVASSSIGFLLGRLRGRNLPETYGGAVVRLLSRRLSEPGLGPPVMAHLLPMAPFALTNLVAGASDGRFPAFMAGTTLGITPRIVLYALFGSQLVAALQQPTAGSILSVLLLTLLTALSGRMAIDRLKGQDRP